MFIDIKLSSKIFSSSTDFIPDKFGAISEITRSNLPLKGFIIFMSSIFLISSFIKVTPVIGSISSKSIANIFVLGCIREIYCDQPPGADPKSKTFL